MGIRSVSAMRKILYPVGVTLQWRYEYNVFSPIEHILANLFIEIFFSSKIALSLFANSVRHACSRSVMLRT